MEVLIISHSKIFEDFRKENHIKTNVMQKKREKSIEYAEDQKDYLSLLQIEDGTDLYNIIRVLLIKAFEAGAEWKQKIIPLHEKTVFSIDEAAIYLSIAKSSVYKLTSGKEIAHYRTGKLIYFRREDLDAWALQKRIERTIKC